MSTLILHIETTTVRCSAALSRDDQLISFRMNEHDRAHSRTLTLQIASCFEEAGIEMKNLDAVSFSAGPGSYTGLRVGLSVAKGICFGLDIPLISVNTLKAMALAMQKEFPDHFYWPMIDARRDEVYTAFYDQNLTTQIPIKALILKNGQSKEEVFAGKNIVIGGDASDKAKEILADERIKYTDIRCDARHNIKPAFRKFKDKDFEDPAYFKSLYLKGPNITRSKKTLFS